MVFAGRFVVSVRRFAARPVGAANTHAEFFRFKDLQQTANQRRFADARPAGDDHQPLPARRPQRRLLTGRQFDVQFFLHPADGGFQINPRQRMAGPR